MSVNEILAGIDFGCPTITAGLGDRKNLIFKP